MSAFNENGWSNMIDRKNEVANDDVETEVGFSIPKIKKCLRIMSGAWSLDKEELDAWNYIADFVEFVVEQKEMEEDDLK